MVNGEHILGFLAVIGAKKTEAEQYLAGPMHLANRAGNLEVTSLYLGELTLHCWERNTKPAGGSGNISTGTLHHHDKDKPFSLLIGKVYGDITRIDSAVEQFAGLNGRYSWVGWEPSQYKFSATSDFLGIRALYYLEAPEVFLVTNEPSVLVNSPAFNGELDPLGCVDMLQKGCCLGNRTMFKQIRYVPPGAQLIRERNDTHIIQKKILPVPFPAPLAGNVDELADGLWERLLNSTQRRIGTRRDWHVLLSGGLDSRVCAGLLHTHDALGGVINWGKSTGGDSRIPYQLAKSLGLRLENISIPPDHLQDYHRDLVTLNAGLTNAHITYLISALQTISASRSPLVIGYSGDPLTGGHVPFTIPGGKSNPSLDESVDHFHRSLGSFFTAQDLPEFLLKDTWVDAIDASRQEIAKVMAAAESSHHYQRWIAALLWCRQLRYTTFLPRLCDNFTPTFSPFEDLEVFQYCLALPPEAIKEQLVYRRMITRHLPDLAKYPRSDGSFIDPTHRRSKLTHLYRQAVVQLPDRLRWQLDWWSGGGYSVDPNADLRTGSAEYLRLLVAEHEKWDVYLDQERVTKLIEDHLSGKQLAGLRIQSLVTVIESIIYTKPK